MKVRIGSTVARSVFLMLLALVVIPGCARNSQGALTAPPVDASHAGVSLQQVAVVTKMILEAAGISVIVLGALAATVHFLYRILRDRFSMQLYHRYREQLGEVILLGLEFLVAADIVGTVSVTLNLEKVVSLAAIILVRTFLSFTLEVETTGYWPWQRGGQSRTGVRERVRQTDSGTAEGQAQEGRQSQP